MQLRLRPIEAGIGQQLFNQRFKLANIPIERLRFRPGEVLAHLQAITQAYQRSAQFMRNAVDQLLLAGNQGVDVIGHLVEGNTEPVKTGTAVEMYAFS